MNRKKAVTFCYSLFWLCKNIGYRCLSLTGHNTIWFNIFHIRIKTGIWYQIIGFRSEVAGSLLAGRDHHMKFGLRQFVYAQAKIDLLISDVMMSQMGGSSLVKKIRKTDKKIKVIFISGYAEDALDDNIMEKDFNFLSKPFSLKQFVEQVKEVLEK